MATSLSKRSSGDPPDREPSSEPIDPTATTPRNDGAPAPTIGNQNLNTNIVYGSVHTINNKNTNYAVYGRPWNELDEIQKTITAALKVRHVPEATYDAQLAMGCMPGTRVQVLNNIDSWIKDPEAPQIFWLTGHAGSGKTAIGHTVCTRAHEDPDIILGGSFFCSRSAGSVNQRDVRCIIPTLAQLLARQSPQFGDALAVELAREPDVLHKFIKKQVEFLLQKPLVALKDSRKWIVFVIDALDECSSQLNMNGTLDDPDSHQIVISMIEALFAFSESSIELPVKFLVTSRPETHIRDTPLSDASFSKVFQLHTVEKETVTEDIRLYILARMSSNTKLRTWFTEHDAELLSQLCGGLFIVATTAINYTLSDGVDRASQRFKALMNATRDGLSAGAVAPLDRMYALILYDATKADNLDTFDLPSMKRVLASLLAARMTLSVSSVADLLGMTKNDLRASLSHMHAVIHVPDGDSEAGLRTLHASFGDYLLERADGTFRISDSLGDTVLTDGCLEVMANQLYFNVSQSRSSYEANQAQKPDSITHSLEYACLHWIYHVARLCPTAPSPPKVKHTGSLSQRFLSLVRRTAPPVTPSKLDEMINAIFRPRLLFWLEIMSLLGQVQRATAMLNFASKTVRFSELARFLQEANTLVASSRKAIERSAPHIYQSALLFGDRDSLVYQELFPWCTGLIDVAMSGIEHHAGQIVMSLTGHTGKVNAVACTSDSQLIVSGSDDGTVRIWNIHTGEEAISPLRSGDGPVNSVAFARAGTVAASGTEAGVVCLWRLLGSQSAVHRFAGQSGPVLSVAFSSDGARLASMAANRTVRIWSVDIGDRLEQLGGHIQSVINVQSLIEGSIIVSEGFHSGPMQLWREFKGSSNAHSICFSPDGKIVGITEEYGSFFSAEDGSPILQQPIQFEQHPRSVALSPDRQTMVFAQGKIVSIVTPSLSTGTASRTDLHGHVDGVTSVTYSSDGLYIISASEDHTIRIWNADRGNTSVPQQEGHSSSINSVAVSADNARIVSASADRSIRVWDARTGQLRLPPLLNHLGMVVCAVISPDDRLIASTSSDSSIMLWDALTAKPIGKPTAGRNHERSCVYYEKSYPPSHTYALSFSPDARWLASVDEAAVRIWDVATRQPLTLGQLVCNSAPLALAFSPDGRILSAGCLLGDIHLWTAATGEPVCPTLQTSSRNPEAKSWLFQPRFTAVDSIGFSPDGSLILSGQQDGAVHIWNVSTGAKLRALRGHTDAVLSVAYSRDGRLIGSGSSDQSVRLWNAETGAAIAILTGHSLRVGSVAFTPDSRSIVSGSQDNAIRAWDLSGYISSQSKSDHDTDPATTLSSATLKDGWLTGRQGELLLWVPPAYLQNLRVYPCYLLIDAGGFVSVNIGANGWHRGESWTSCWRQDTPNSGPRTS